MVAGYLRGQCDQSSHGQPIRADLAVLPTADGHVGHAEALGKFSLSHADLTTKTLYPFRRTDCSHNQNRAPSKNLTNYNMVGAQVQAVLSPRALQPGI